MTHNYSNPSDQRRILTFPVVHPCQSISPTTLLHSLISLASKISDYNNNQSNHHHQFTTQKRNARETLRHIGNLLIFLEEIRDTSTVLPESINLCFFELHLTFQKILFLFEDCTREGAQLWILMKFNRVSTEFQVLIRTISTALDVLPLRSIRCLSTEAKELVQFVSKQAVKAKLVVDLEDEKAAVTVLSILNQFENRVDPAGSPPDPMVLKSVLEHLEIRSWSQCNKEIKFLEEEIFLGSSSTTTGGGIRSNNGGGGEEEKHVVFLKNLMALMIYSRVVLFDRLDRIRSNASDDLTRLMNINGCRFDGDQMLNCLNPEDFKCPISLEIMADPVTVSTGHTYDRASIEKWFKAGNLICPNTGENVSSIELVPNWALQKLIRRYCSDNGIPMVREPAGKRTLVSPRNPVGAAEAALRMLSIFLAGSLKTGTGAERNKAAYEVRLLAKSNIFNMSSCLVEAGTIPFLLNLLSSMSSSIQENSMAALLNLSKLENEQFATENKRLIVENCGLILIMDVLEEGLKTETKQLAASTLFHLSSIEEYRKLIGEIPEAIPTLVGLIKDKSLHTRVKKSAVVAIFGLLLFRGNHQKVLQAGTIPLLVDILVSSEGSTTDVITESLAVLELIAEKPEGAFAILYTSTALHRLVGVLSSSSTSSQAKEYCASVLLSLCINGGSEVVAKLQKASSLMTSLYSLLTQGTSRASKKATAILRILHEFNGPSTSTSRYSAPEVRQDRSVHVW